MELTTAARIALTSMGYLKLFADGPLPEFVRFDPFNYEGEGANRRAVIEPGKTEVLPFETIRWQSTYSSPSFNEVVTVDGRRGRLCYPPCREHTGCTRPNGHDV